MNTTPSKANKEIISLHERKIKDIRRGRVSRIRTFKKRYFCDCKITCISDKNCLNLFRIDTAKKHDLTILKEEEFDKIVKVEYIIGDKGYVNWELPEKMEKGGFVFIPIKRKNMIKSEEAKYYKSLSKMRKKINTFLSCR